MFFKAAALLATALSASGAMAQYSPSSKPLIKPGNWRIAVSMEVPNATGPSTGPVEYDRCLSPDDTRNLLMMPPNSGCSLRDSKTLPDSLTWRVQCTQNGYTSVADGKIEFKDTRIEGKILTVAQGGNIRITTRMSGRYVGPCIQLGKKAPADAAPASPAPQKAPATKLPKFPEN